MKLIFPAWLRLTIICLVAALLLGATNYFTKDIIADRNKSDREKSMKTLISNATEFKEESLNEGSSLTSLYKAYNGSEELGYIAQISNNGYGGPIEILVAVDNSKKLYGIVTGGSDFAETAGLGSLVKEASFTDQYKGLTAPITLTKAGKKVAENNEVDQISGATISSKAVNDAVNKALEYLNTID